MMPGAVLRERSSAGRLLAAGLAILTSTISTALAQEPNTTFRSGTQIVEIDVRAFDSAGRFASALTIDDFTLFENGTPQKIEALYLVSNGTVESSSLAAGSRQPPAKQTWLFLFDTPHLTAAGLSRTRDAAKAFVHDRFRDGDFAGVIVNGRMVNNRISSTTEEIETALSSVKQPGDLTSRRLELRTWPRLMDEDEAKRIVDNDQYTLDIAVRRACEDEPESCRGGSPDLAVSEKAARVIGAARTAARETVDTIIALCSGLARIPGPKTIVMLSEGFTFDGVEPLMTQAIAQAARAGARFYTVDARGLNRGPGMDNANRATIDDPAAGVRFDMQSDGINSLGVDTGGMAIRNENNFRHALDQIDRDSTTYYVLLYSPSDLSFDGKYRSVTVQVKPAGLKVRARRGYLALAPAKMLVPAAPTTPAPVATNSEAKTDSAATRPQPEAPPVSGAGVSAGAMAPSPAAPVPPVAARTRVNAGALVMELAKGSDREDVAGSEKTGAEKEGWAAYERGDVKLAARLLGEAAARPDARPWVSYAAGLANLADGRPADAVRAWESVCAAVPQFQPVYFDIADAYLQLGDEGKAVAILRSAQKRWPADPEVLNALGVTQLRRGSLDDAIESFEKAIAAAPAESAGYFNLASAYHIRYFKSHRYNSILNKWTGNDHDREAATVNFQRYIEMGGPYVQRARDALAALAWK